MNKKLLGAILMVGLLAGCYTETAEEQTARINREIAYHRKHCESYGYKPDTPEIAACVRNEYILAQKEREEKRRKRWEAVGRIGDRLGEINDYPAYPSSNSNITCNTFGNTTNCSTW